MKESVNVALTVLIVTILISIPATYLINIFLVGPKYVQLIPRENGVYEIVPCLSPRYPTLVDAKK